MSTKSLRVGRSKTGLGLFARAGIAKGALVAIYRGSRIPTKVAQAREKTHGSRYMFEIDKRWTIDGSSRKNLARYANHSCRPNAEADLVGGHILLRAVTPIGPDEEITYDYGEEYFDLFIRPHGCRCEHCAEKKRKRKSNKTLR